MMIRFIRLPETEPTYEMLLLCTQGDFAPQNMMRSIARQVCEQLVNCKYSSLLPLEPSLEIVLAPLIILTAPVFADAVSLPLFNISFSPPQHK